MNFGRTRLLLLSVLALMALSVACGGDDDGDAAAVVTLILSPSPNANHAGVYLAQQKGYFTEENLTVNIEFSADPESAMRAVGAETKDFVIGNQLTLLKLRDEEVSVMGIAAITQHALHGIVAPASAGVENPLDLVGMKVGYPGTTNSERFLNTMLVSDGANGTQDVELVSFESGLTEALLNGTVDAIMSPDWPHAQAEADNQGQPVTVLRFKGWSLPEHYEHMLVTSERNFKKRENLVRRFTRAIRRGYEDALADPQGGIDALQAGTTENIDETLERAAADLLAPLWAPFRPIRGSRVALIGDQDVNVYLTLIRWMRDNKLVGSVVHYSTAYHNKFSLIEE